MSKKAFIVFVAVLVGIVVPSFNNSVGAYSTTVRYSSPGSSYYELIVPLVMAPGETATVSAVGTWNSQTALEVTADENVTLICDENDDEIDLGIFFDGILEPGIDGSQTEASASISVEDIDSSVIGTWEGTFNYNVSLVEYITEHSGIIPEGGTYYVSATKNEPDVGDFSQATATYEAGDEFPATFNNGDVYVFGDYEYRYQCGYEGAWLNDYVGMNWGVTVRDHNKASYGNMLYSINGSPVNNLTGAFWGCKNLVKSPKLPPEGKYMVGTFWYCPNLKVAPVIPENASMLLNAFIGCSALEKAPTIPAGAEDIENIFAECISLSGSLEINGTHLSIYTNALKGTKISEITGTISDELKAEILATK